MLLLLIYCLQAAGCTTIQFDIEETIKPPEYENLAVQGTWTIEGYIQAVSQKESITNESIKKNYIGKSALFDSEISSIGPDICVNPQYRVVRTLAEAFIQSKYRTDGSKLQLDGQTISVVNITSEDQLFYEVLVTEKDKAYVYMDNGFLVLSKTSDKVDSKVKAESLANKEPSVRNGQNQEDPLLRSGLLIGIRTPDNLYKTIWIYSENREIKSISGVKQLLVPRAKGFWQLGTVNKNNIHAIYAEPFNDKMSSDDDRYFMNIPGKNVLNVKPGTRIHFVGNDYIGTETDGKFKVFPLEDLNGSAVTYAQLGGTEAQKVIEKTTKDRIAAIKGDAAERLINQFDPTNFMLVRRNGHWVTRSRLFFEQPYKEKYMDFDINVLLTQKLIYYDELGIQWKDIKKKLPWTTDAFMSPNKEIVVLTDENGLNVYTVKNGDIIKQILKLQLEKEETVVMAEWCVGRYADIWNNFVNKLDTMNY